MTEAPRCRGRRRTSGGALVLALALAIPLARPVEAQGRRPAVPDGRDRRETGSVADSLDAPPPAVAWELLGRDTVVAAPGATYPAGPLRRLLFGDLNRDLWEIEFPVPVLDLDRVGGGLEVEELSGGLQTLGIRFRSRDGRTFQFRSLVKNAERALPDVLHGTPASAVAQDQMGALFPLSAMVVAELLGAVDVRVARPRPVVMPDDPRLGRYREAFAGRMGWIEERPDEREGDTPGFDGSTKITGTDELLEELDDDPRSYVDSRAFLRARLVDMLVSDWDRHQDQWRWAAFDEGPRTRWDPIPRDRDWALTRLDGLLPAITRVYAPKYVGLSSDPPDPFRLHWSAQGLDRRWLTPLSRAEFMQVASEVRRRLDDDALARAIGVLPASYRERVGDRLARDLRARRDALEDVARRFYELLAGEVDVFGTEEPETLEVEAPGEGLLRVRLTSRSEDGLVLYERLFRRDETREVRVYLGDGDDDVVARGDRLPIDVRVAGGAGDDRYQDETASGAGLHIYDSEGDNAYAIGPDAYRTGSPFAGQEAPPPPPYFAWDRRDWGYAWVPRPEIRYDSDLGVYVGFGISRYGYGFGRAPYRSKYSASVLSGFAPDEWIGDVELERPFGDRGWWGVLNLDWATQEPVWFYGFGNETTPLADESRHRAHRNRADVWLRARWAPDSIFAVSVGPEGTFQGPIHGDGTVLDTLDVYGTRAFHQVGVRARLRYDSRDDYDLPASGVVLQVDGRGVPALIDVEEPFAGLRAETRAYVSAGLAGDPTLHLRLTGERVWGRAPFAELPFVGGSSTLPGTVRRRFVGETAVAGVALLRWRIAPLHIVTDLELGVHGLAGLGRVWLDGETSDAWHRAFGGGIWLHLPALERTLSLTYARGEQGSAALYADLGLPF